ncbi:MAG TPA: NADH-quinone oxidoreductase subunit C [Vicinamibacterales bacterium]|jgi:NADH-quinone oxidoreductase subunit C|nr:NADH-quinone oxidoreductase subunit C [Vicinamibacterales bacterium]
MDADTLVAAIAQALPGVAIDRAPSVDLQPTVYVQAGQLIDAARGLRDRPELKFDCLAEVTAVDFWPREPRFEVVYLLIATDALLRLRLKVRLDGAAARLPSLSAVWPSANWLEREVWDLFGIVFDGHPDPRRLLMPEDWEGFPLRKDYPVQINQRVKTSEPMQLTEEEFRENLRRDRLTRG